MPPPLVWLWDYIFQRKSLNEVSNTAHSLLQAQPLVASHQLTISFTFSFGYQSSSVLTVFRIRIICIWNKDTQRSQSLETTIAPKFKVQNRPKIAQKNRHNVTIFRMPSPKISTNQKIVPTDQHYQHVFATLLHILFTPPEEKIKRPWIWYMRRKFQKATTRPY